MAKVQIAAEVLPTRVFYPDGDDFSIGQVAGVPEELQTDHQATWMAGQFPYPSIKNSRTQPWKIFIISFSPMKGITLKTGPEKLRIWLKKAGLTPLLKPRRSGFPMPFQSLEEFHAELKRRGESIEFEEFWIDLQFSKRNYPDSYSPMIRLHQACQARLATEVTTKG